MPILTVQKRMMELGRVRLGDKGPKGEPRKLGTFRFTSASKALLDAVAAHYGGKVTEWEGAPDEGYFQVTTAATDLDIILPPTFSAEDGTPTVAYSQWYELWSAGGCKRRCDGQTEALSGKPCMCDPEKRKQRDKTVCAPTTRVSFMLPDIPGLGVWRLDSKGWNAAVELPVTLEILARAAEEHRFIPAVLRAQQRSTKKEGKTLRYIVPVIDLKDVTVRQLAAGEVPDAINPPSMAKLPKPALPAAGPLPVDASFENDRPVPMGAPPALPEPEGHGAQGEPATSSAAALDEVSVGSHKTASGSESVVDKLTIELIEASKGLGNSTTVVNAIRKNRAAHADDLGKHRAWLVKQLANLQTELPV